MTLALIAGNQPSDAIRSSAPSAPLCRTWVIAASAFALLICTGGPSTYVALHVITRGGNRDWIRNGPFGAVALAGAVLLGLHLVGIRPRRYPLPLIPVAAYVAWAAISTTWSVLPRTSAREALIGTGIASFGCWFGWCLTIHEQIWSVTLSMSAAVLASAWVIEYRPAFGRVYMGIGERPLWQGIFGNRNSLAPVCVLGLLGLLGLVLLRPTVARFVVGGALGVVHAVLLQGSGGLTSTLAIVLIALVAIVVPFLWWLRHRGVPGWTVAAGLVALCLSAWVVVFSVFDWIVTSLGREDTLTGRRFIWADVRSFIDRRPIVGAGFSAFWDRPDLTQDSYSRLGQYASAHNSILEVLLGLGVVGLLVFLTIALNAVVGAFRWVWRGWSVAAFWWTMVVVFEVAENAMESFVLWQSYIWVLLVAASVITFGPSARLRMEPAGVDDTTRIER